MATKLVSVLTGGSNNHETSSAEINGIATDFISEGVVGAISATSGVAPTTGAFAVNAIGTPTMDVRVTNGVAYVTATPTGGTSQTFRVNMDSTEDVTIAANATGGTRYDWVYIKLDADKLVNPAVDASDVATLTTSRSTSASTDNGTPPTYGYPVAIVTVANGASSITNANITDARIRTGANSVPSTALVNAKSLYNPYKFSIYRAAAYSTVATTRTVMPFDTKRFDTNSNADVVTNKGRYTAPVAGYYYFTAQIGGPVAGYRIMELWVNNVKVRQGDSHYYTTAQTVSTHLSALVQLAAADYVEIKYYTDGSQAVPVTSGDEAYFDGFLVSTT